MRLFSSLEAASAQAVRGPLGTAWPHAVYRGTWLSKFWFYFAPSKVRRLPRSQRTMATATQKAPTAEQMQMLEVVRALRGPSSRQGGLSGRTLRTAEEMLKLPRREDMAEVKIGFSPVEVLGGPHAGMTPEQEAEVMVENRNYSRRGEMHTFWMKCQDEIAARVHTHSSSAHAHTQLA